MHYKQAFSFLFLSAITFTFNLVFAQYQDHTKSKKAIEVFEEGLKFYQANNTNAAYEQFTKALEKDENFVDPYIIMGEIQRDSGNYDTSNELFYKALDKSPDFASKLHYNIALNYYDNYDCAEAISAVDKYLLNNELSKIAEARAETLKKNAGIRLALLNNPSDFSPVNLGEAINTEYQEHSPSLTADDAFMIFTRLSPKTIQGQTFKDEDLYYSTRNDDGSWVQSKVFSSEVNTEYPEGTSCISPDGRYVFLTRCGDSKGMGSCDIYLSVRNGKTLQSPRNLGAPINSSAWESQPSFSSDGRTLFFTSNRRGGQGQQDIYMSKITDNGQWSVPVNLPINTRGREQSPFIHPNGKQLFFSSDGHPGMGGTDLFVVDIDEEGNCSDLVNLGYPINERGDEVSFVVNADGSKGYYASERSEGYGSWDIYMFELPEHIKPEPVSYLKGRALDAKTNKPLQAKFEILDLETGKRVVESYSDAETGEFLVVLPVNSAYALNVSKDGYLFHSEQIFINANETKEHDVALQPLQVGERIVLENVFFETGSYQLKASSDVELKKVVEMLKKNPELNVEIGGHTDNIGSLESNQILSENRALAVKDALIRLGADGAKLSSKGYNFSMPVASNESEEGRAKNRRTELKIIE